MTKKLKYQSNIFIFSKLLINFINNLFTASFTKQSIFINLEMKNHHNSTSISSYRNCKNNNFSDTLSFFFWKNHQPINSTGKVIKNICKHLKDCKITKLSDTFTKI